MNDSRPFLIMKSRESPVDSPSDEGNSHVQGNNRSHHSPAFMGFTLMKVNNVLPNQKGSMSPMLENHYCNGAPELQRKPPTLEVPPKTLNSQTVVREPPAYTSINLVPPKSGSATSKILKRYNNVRTSKPKKTPVGPVQVRRYPLRLRRPPVRLSF